jgi:hypothetical protein
MGSKWFTGGVVAAPRGRIQFDSSTTASATVHPSSALHRKPISGELENASK